MNDLISRQAAIAEFDGAKVDEENCTEYDIGYNDGINFAVSRLSVLPSAEPVRKGKWIPIQRGFFNKEVTQVKCDQCGNLLDLIGVNCGRGNANFYPNCGADMRGDG